MRVGLKSELGTNSQPGAAAPSEPEPQPGLRQAVDLTGISNVVCASDDAVARAKAASQVRMEIINTCRESCRTRRSVQKRAHSC